MSEGYENVFCEWFAACTRPATGSMSHPILGAMLICDRCRAIVE